MNMSVEALVLYLIGTFFSYCMGRYILNTIPLVRIMREPEFHFMECDILWKTDFEHHWKRTLKSRRRDSLLFFVLTIGSWAGIFATLVTFPFILSCQKISKEVRMAIKQDNKENLFAVGRFLRLNKIPDKEEFRKFVESKKDAQDKMFEEWKKENE